MKQTSEKFYYCGEGDYESYDNVNFEHCRHSPYCKYLDIVSDIEWVCHLVLMSDHLFIKYAFCYITAM